MCYSRKSFVSDERSAATTDQSRKMEDKRDARIDTLLREAHKEDRTMTPEEAPTRESVPVK